MEQEALIVLCSSDALNTNDSQQENDSVENNQCDPRWDRMRSGNLIQDTETPQDRLGAVQIIAVNRRSVTGKSKQLTQVDFQLAGDKSVTKRPSRGNERT